MSRSAEDGPLTGPPDWSSLSAAKADALAWRAICDWPSVVGFDPVVDGIDYGRIARFHLRHKVGRAIRRLREPDGGRFEESLLSPVKRQERGPWWVPGERWEWMKRPLRPIVGPLLSTLASRRENSTLTRLPTPDPPPPCDLFVPLMHANWSRTLRAIRETGLLVGTGEGPGPALAGARGRAALESARPFALAVRRAIEEALRRLDVVLMPRDANLLELELRTCRATVDVVREELEARSPRLLITYADDHSPQMEYVLVARQIGLPSLMVQHGLDCENFSLDHAYADHIAVWGPERRDRYRARSEWQPLSIEVTGDPQHDNYRVPDRLGPPGNEWLWATRPHTPDKCYLPSRRVDEGLEILDALLDLIASHESARLTIKAHRYDYANLYDQRVLERKLTDRVIVSSQNLLDLTQASSVVFSEDSTAGMDAMILGKPLVHTHFADTDPAMPFVDYGAALPGFDPTELRESIATLETLSSDQASNLLEGQRRFLFDFGGPWDGRAGHRLTKLIEELT